MNLKHLVGAALLLAPLSGFAASATATLNASAIIVPACTVKTLQDINFGEYTPAADKTASGTISVNCSDSIPYTVTIGNGLNATKVRRMATLNSTRDSPKLAYQLFQDAQMTNAWGSNETHSKAGTGSGNEQELTVYGKVDANQTSRPGSYSDTVTVTVSFDGPAQP